MTAAAVDTPFAPWPQDSGTARERLLRGIDDFHRRTAPPLSGVFAELATGQHPTAMFIGCADSRVVPNLITGSGPGDLFTVRAVGNLVPTWENARQAAGGDAVAAAVDYAVTVLGVGAVVVCGHSSCGAMNALLADTPADSAVGAWLTHAAEARDRPEPPGTVDRSAADRLAMANVGLQLEHLRTHPAVARALDEGTVALVGMFFDIAAARTLVRDDATGAFG